jgi:hypothetical protein
MLHWHRFEIIEAPGAKEATVDSDDPKPSLG